MVNPVQLSAVEPPVRGPDGIWVLSRHADVRAVLRAPNVGVDTAIATGIARVAARSGRDLSGLLRGHGALPNMRDGAEHAASRRAFACHAARLLADEDCGFGARLERALAALPSATPIDAMADLIHPLVDAHLSETLDIPRADLHRQQQTFVNLFESVSPVPALALMVQQSVIADTLFAEAAALLRNRGVAAPDTADLGALFFAANLAGDGLRGLFAQVVLRLAGAPGLRQHLRDDPAAVEGFVRECLRLSALLPHITRRVVSGEIVLAGAVLRAGDRLRLDLGRANRDPEVFAEPERFWPERPAQPHLAFAAGVHTCQGARATKSLTETFTLRIATGFDLATDCARPALLPGRITRIPDRLMVTLTPLPG